MDFSFIDIPLYLFFLELLLKRERCLLSFFVYLFKMTYQDDLNFL